MRDVKTSLQVSQFIKADPLSVFDAWVKPELMKKWFCPKELKPGKISADVRVGGSFRGEMIGPDETFTAIGVYKEVVPGTRLVFTHGWYGEGHEETLVTVEFRAMNGGTEVTLTHERLTDPESLKGHEEGWKSTLENLATKVF